METKSDRQLETIDYLKTESEDQQQQILNLYTKINEDAKNCEDKRIEASQTHDDQLQRLKDSSTAEKKQLLQALSRKFLTEKQSEKM